MQEPSQDRRELQADELLAAAERYQSELLRMAVRLAGSSEAGMDVFQQAVLNCHDAVQRWGFNEGQGGQYRFYLLRSIRNLVVRSRTRQRPYLPLPDELPQAEPTQPLLDERASLAEQIAAEARKRFAPADRLALRLHVDGYGCQEIADMIGRRDRTWVWRRLERMKDVLRGLFQQSFNALGE